MLIDEMSRIKLHSADLEALRYPAYTVIRFQIDGSLKKWHKLNNIYEILFAKYALFFIYDSL